MGNLNKTPPPEIIIWRERNEEICEEDGRVVGIPVVALPVVVPVPLATAPVPAEVQRIAAAERTAESRSVNKDVSGVAVGFLLQSLRDHVFVVPECLEDPGVHANSVLRHEPMETLFTGDVFFSSVQSGIESNAVDINFGQGERAFVLLFLAFESIAISGSPPDGPALADELGRIEGLGTGDGEDGSDIDTTAVLKKGGKTLTEILRRELYYFSLQSFRIELIPVYLGRDSSGDF